MSVNLSPVAGAAAQFLDNSGNVLTGGKLYTYAAGTTTPQATYTSSDGVTFHTNPIILDAAGRVSNGGEIWLTDGISYKFVLKDANDVLIGTWDNLIGINSNFLNFYTQEEIQTATAGQTVFTLSTVTYTPGTNSLSVFVDGVNQYDGASYAYIETDSTTVTFTAGLHVGALVKFTTAVAISGGASNASNVIYDPAGAGAVATTVQAKLRQTVSVKDFGAVGDGTTDDTTALTNARNYIAAQTTPVALIFPAGIYKYSVSPNWAIYDATIQAEGMVRLRYTGTNNAVIIDAGATIASKLNINFVGNFIVEATSAAKNGYFVRGIQHSKIQGRVDGCGATYSALRVEFCILTEFAVKTSINETGAWYTGAQPAIGIYVTRRDPGELTTACTFINPIVEGVSGDGIVLDYASNNIFIGGASEGNTGSGLSTTANSVANLIEGTDFESNGGSSCYDGGNFNTFSKINGTNVFTCAGTYTRVINSNLLSVADSGLATSFINTTYNGTMSGTQANQNRYNLFNSAGYFEQNVTSDSIINSSVSVPTATPTTVLTVPYPSTVSGNRYYQVIVYKAGLGTAYAAYALVYRDVSTCYIVSQVNGANLTLTVSGLNVLATQTSGSTITGMFAKANAI